MRKAFHEELDRVTEGLVEMTRLASSAMSRATTALLDADVQLAESVIGADAAIDALREELDLLSFDLLALQQPVATDLRMVVTSMRMSSDIERMGDLARHVAKVARLRYPNSAVPARAPLDHPRDGPGRRAHRHQGRLGHRGPRRRGRQADRARRRRDGRPAPSALRGASPRTPGTTRPRRPSTSPSSAATTSASPTTPSRSPAASSSSSPASTAPTARPATRTTRTTRPTRRPRLPDPLLPHIGRPRSRMPDRTGGRSPDSVVCRLTQNVGPRASQRPWLATAAAAASAAAGSRYSPGLVGMKSSPSS